MSIVERLKQLQPSEWKPHRPASAEELEELEQLLGLPLPADYRAVLLYSNGGSIYRYPTTLNLFSVMELKTHIREAEYEPYIPGMMTIASDGGDAIFNFDLHNRLGRGAFAVFFVELSVISFDRSTFVGHNISETIERVLANENLGDLLPTGDSQKD